MLFIEQSPVKSGIFLSGSDLGRTSFSLNELGFIAPSIYPQPLLGAHAASNDSGVGCRSAFIRWGCLLAAGSRRGQPSPWRGRWKINPSNSPEGGERVETGFSEPRGRGMGNVFGQVWQAQVGGLFKVKAGKLNGMSELWLFPNNKKHDEKWKNCFAVYQTDFWMSEANFFGWCLCKRRLQRWLSRSLLRPLQV